MLNSNLSHDDVLTRADSLDFPDSVLDYFEGLMGQPFDGFPEPLRTQVLARARRAKISGQASARLELVDLESVREQLLAKYGDSITKTDVCSHVVFPNVFTQYRGYLARFGDVSPLPTQQVLAPPKIGEEMECPVSGGLLVRVQLLAVQPQAEGEDSRQSALYSSESMAGIGRPQCATLSGKFLLFGLSLFNSGCRIPSLLPKAPTG